MVALRPGRSTVEKRRQEMPVPKSVVLSSVVLSVTVLWLALSAALVFGQSERGAITGTITDSSGAVVPGVEVTVTNVDTNVPYSMPSTGTGTYRVLNLPPGKLQRHLHQGGLQANCDCQRPRGGERHRECRRYAGGRCGDAVGDGRGAS